MSFIFIVFVYVSYITLLPIDNPHAAAVDTGMAINPIPVRDNVIELDVVPIITNVSIDFSIVVSVLYSFFTFFSKFVVFVFEVCNHFFNVIDMVVKTVNIT